jgi:predicted permease
VLLAFLGAAAGLAISIWFSAFLIHTLWTGYVPTSVAVLPDARVLTFTGTVALLSAMLFALAPARKILQNNKGWSLQLSSRGALGGLGNAARLLLSAQTALCTLLVISAALLSATIQNLASTDRGFHSDGILILTMFPQPGRETLADRTAYYRDLAERLRGLPGVTAVSYSNMGPAMRNDFKVGVAVSGKEGQQQKAVEESVAPNVFNLLGMRVLAGRQFSWRDDSTSHPVAIISDSLAKGMFPAESPLGRKIDIGSDANQRGVEIVGIVNSASLWRLQSDRPDAVYLPLMQQPNQNEPNLEIATAGDPHVLASAARRIVEAAGHHYPLRIQTLRERSDMMLANEHVLAMVSALLATLALLMGGIGIYSLLSHSVTRRTSEIGLRIALGARPLQVTNLILAEVSRLVGLGLLVGVAVDLAISRLIEAMLFGISATNPTVVILACATLACLALVAAYSPARRAAGLDPTTALRTE